MLPDSLAPLVEWNWVGSNFFYLFKVWVGSDALCQKLTQETSIIVTKTSYVFFVKL